MTQAPGLQWIKSRDDSAPISLARSSESGAGFVLNDGMCSWASTDQSIGVDLLRERLEPWLTALVQADHLSLLLGSGLTEALHVTATGKPTPGMAKVLFSTHSAALEAEVERLAVALGRGEGNVEDQLRVAQELLRGLEILAGGEGGHDASFKALALEFEDVLDAFARSILQAEHAIIAAPAAQRETAMNYLVSFLLSFASRTGTRDRLQIFTTNYDRMIEAGAELAGIHLLDRFVGSIAPILRASRLDLDMHYNPPGIRGEPRYLEGVARFTKLHGSVDWLDVEGTIRRIGLPIGVNDIGPFINHVGEAAGRAGQLMIYPNAAKDRETSDFPYVELFRDLASAVCRPNSTLFTYGYGFGDEHINRVIRDMLTIPSTHLVVIAYGDPLGRIMDLYKRVGRPAQMTVLVGDHLGSLPALVDNYLPKPAIDRTTFRMADLLKSRWSQAGARAEPDVELGEVE